MTGNRATSTPRVTVIGTGYLGATHAACMAELGFEVLGVDVDETKIEKLASGEVPFHESGLPELVRRHTASGRLKFTTSFAEAGAFGNVHFLCVGTPQVKNGHAADLSFLYAALDGIASHLRGSHLIVGKSTVPVGTAEAMAKRIVSTAPPGAEIELAWNPEFLREGFAVEDTLRPNRIVVGAMSDFSERRLREVYATPLAAGTPFLVTDLATAELVKVAANSFLATKISFINAMSEVCDAAGADVTMLAEAIGLDERIGSRFLRAGVGFGGGCLPKDIRAFQSRADELGVGQSLRFLAEVDAVNDRSRERVIEAAQSLTGGELAGRRVAVLGAAFKPDTDDVRDSPALACAIRAQREGADVAVYDPMALSTARNAAPSLRFEDSLESVLTDADVVLVLTEWAEFREADPRDLVGLPRMPAVVDGRNVLDLNRWADAGWHVEALGQPGRKARSEVLSV